MGEDEIPELNFGISNYDYIYTSLMTNLVFLTFTGWGMISDLVKLNNFFESIIISQFKFWHAVNYYLFGIFALGQILLV